MTWPHEHQSTDAPTDAPDGTASETGIDWGSFDAVLFDLDGVLTPTATVHEHAWKRMFDEFFAQRPEDQEPFSGDDYLRYVDGRARFAGVQAMLDARSIVLPYGDDDDAPGHGSICALGNLKNALFARTLAEDGIEAYPGSVAVLDLLERLDVEVAVVSSSRNAPDVLAAAGLAHRFEVVIDGNVAVERGIPGKPAPGMYLAAAADLGVGPGRAAVVEDAISGVAAGRAGDFALVLGIDRGAWKDALLEHGADVVVKDLGDTIVGHRGDRDHEPRDHESSDTNDGGGRP